MIDDFIERKWGRRAVEYMFPELEPILKETLGVIVYQEQVMQISFVIGGYSLGGADLLRRAMGKKIAEEMAKQRDLFMKGAVEKKFPKDKSGQLFDLMEQFAGYGFNKSHSAAYALLAYHTAWLKTHYPVEFIAALLTSETSKPENVVKYIGECREMNIPVVPPNVLMSDANFTPVRTEQGSAIGFGLAAISRTTVTMRFSRSSRLAPLCVRKGSRASLRCGTSAKNLDLSRLNKRVLESLIKAGAMDSLALVPRQPPRLIARWNAHKKRPSVTPLPGRAVSSASSTPTSRPARSPKTHCPVCPSGTNTHACRTKEVLGFFVSGHPMDKYREKLRNIKFVDTATAVEMKPEPQVFRRGRDEQPQNEIQIAGVITGLKRNWPSLSARANSMPRPRLKTPPARSN